MLHTNANTSLYITCAYLGDRIELNDIKCGNRLIEFKESERILSNAV